MNDHHDPETEDRIRRALAERADGTVTSPDSLDAIQRRRVGRSWARPATYAAVAAAIVLIAGVALANLPDDDGPAVDSAVSTTLPTTLPSYPTVAPPDPYPTTGPTPPPSTSVPAVDPEEQGTPAAAARDGRVLWPLDGDGAASPDDAAIEWITEYLDVDHRHAVERPLPGSPANSTSFVLPFVGEDGEPRLEEPGITIFVGSPDGLAWYVTEVTGPSIHIDLVERNGFGPGIRVTGSGAAFEGTGLLWVDDVGPVVVSLGANGRTGEFSVVLPDVGPGPVRIRLETGTALEGEVPSVHAFAVEPAPASTDLIVVDVADDDVLNVRTAAGVDNEIAFTLDPQAQAITQTGATERVGEATWWEIIGPDGSAGWVNARFLSVQREVVADTPLADQMTGLARQFLLVAADQPAALPDTPPQHPDGTEVGGIGIYADGPTPYVTVADLWADTLIDWDPFPDEVGSECGDFCERTVRDFLDIRPRDIEDDEYAIGLEGIELGPATGTFFLTGRSEEYYDRVATVVVYVPPESDDVLDWRRITFAFDFIDGTPTISQVWLWGWTP